MQKLISELNRLYLLRDQMVYDQGSDGTRSRARETLSPTVLAQHLRGDKTLAVDLVNDAGLSRVIVIAFDGVANGNGARHWSTLCAVANALQEKLALPAPAVSISGATSYGLWLSVESPIPAAQARRFVELVHRSYFPREENSDLRPPDNAGLSANVDHETAELPPCLHRATGKWAAFIHPGMGGAFSDEPGLEMAPPADAQAAFLAGLNSMTVMQFKHALEVLERGQEATAGSAGAQASTVMAASMSIEGLLLKDATLEDIVKFLHAKNIEPTFRHLI